MQRRSSRAAAGSVAGRGRIAALQSVALRLAAPAMHTTPAPELVGAGDHPGVVVRTIADGPVHRTIFAATRAADARRPSVQALLAAVRTAAAELGW